MASGKFTEKKRKELSDEIIEMCRIDPGEKFRISDYDPAWMGTPEMIKLGEEVLKKGAKRP